MLDLAAAKRSQVLKLEFNYSDYEVMYQCVRTVMLSHGATVLSETKRNKIEQVEDDLGLLLAVMREEGDV